MKKIVSLMLIMCILSMSALPVLAQPVDDMVQPYAALSLSGGMAYGILHPELYTHFII